MAFNYGKKTMEIGNPFKTEGILDLFLGIGTLILGLFSVFEVRVSIGAELKILAWFELVVAIVFLTIGLRSLIVGCMRLFKFLVGRDVPSDLSPYSYDEKMVEDILMKRSNPTFIERDGFISRLLISLYSKFLFLPIAFRNMLETVSSLFFSFLIFTVVYLLTLFSTSIGLINLTDKQSIMALFSLFFLVKQLIVWYHYRPTKRRMNAIQPSVYGFKNIVVNILLAVMAPVLLEILVRNGVNMPVLPINIYMPIAVLFIFSLLLVFVAYYLSLKRLQVLNPETEVSEYTEHIQVSVHPKDIFRCFEIEMAQKRYQELPNRIYKQIKPVLELEGSQNKGSFHGSTVQETQPIYKPGEWPRGARNVRFFAALTGRVLMFLSFIVLFLSFSNLSHGFTVDVVFKSIYYPVLTYFFAYYLNRIAHLFYSEVLFSSYLVHFFSDGTYTESKVSSGMSVYDSNRSENTIVNSSATPWILVSKIVTSTFADSSTKNLEGNRYILEMYKADEFLNSLVGGFTNYFKNRKLIVGLENQADIQNSMKFHNLNELSRSSSNAVANSLDSHTGREELSE